MKRKYLKPEIFSIVIDKKISLVMMTNEGTPPDGPFFNQINKNLNNTKNPYKA